MLRLPIEGTRQWPKSVGRMGEPATESI